MSTSGKLGILWSHNKQNFPNWLDSLDDRLRLIEERGVWWDVGFRMDLSQFRSPQYSSPLEGYIWNTIEKVSTHKALINLDESECQPKKNKVKATLKELEAWGITFNMNSPLKRYLADAPITLTLLRLKKFERLSIPLKLEEFRLWNGSALKVPPFNYRRIILP